MLRAPYFAYTACVSLLIAISSFSWLNVYGAMEGQYLWLLMLSTVLSYLGGGFAIGVLAKARSRDINGKANLALLAFIPVVNLVLLLRPSQDLNSPQQFMAPKIFSGALGVFVALAFTLGAGALSAIGSHLVGQAIKAHEKMPVVDQVAFLIRARGLEWSIALMANEAKLPMKVDSETTLVSITPDKTKFVRTFVVTSQINQPLNQFRVRVRQNVCADPILSLVLTSGGTLIERYTSRNGEELASVTVEGSDCKK